VARPPRRATRLTLERTVRVIAGTLRGAPLSAPPARGTRPITDRVKESLFNILGHRIGTLAALPPVAVLDLFAGSGALGIEALSRGAATCLFVEHDRRAAAVLRENLARLKLAAVSRIAADNAWTMRIPPAPGGAGYGLVFIDPPYRDAEHPLRVADLLDRAGAALADDGFLVFRHEARRELVLPPLRTLVVDDERRFRHMELRLLRRPDAPGIAIVPEPDPST
jgi:16S rRNA (guanine966-N2)-methyltransferase